MHKHSEQPRALFLSPNGHVYPDTVICTGVIPADFRGKPCPHSHDGHFPGVNRLDAHKSGYSIDKGRDGDLCPNCAISQLAHLGHWQGHTGTHYPEELLSLRLFKCRAGFWLVVPGLKDDDPSQIQRGK